MGRPSATAGRRRYEWWFVAAIAVAVLVLGITTWATQRGVLEEVGAELERKLDVYTAYLESESRRFELMPDIIALAPDVRRLLATPDDPAAVAAANAYLAAFASVTGASVAYVMDPNGLTRAASNHAQEGTFVGHNYSFRPYFKAAAQGGRGRYVALGATSNVPGYYVAVPVTLGGRLAGVAVVKYAAETLMPWTGGSDKVLVVGADKVAFAASDPRLRFARLDRLLDGETEPVDPRQYGNRPLVALPLHSDAEVGGVRMVTLEPAAYWGEFGLGGQPAEYAVAAREVSGSGWRVVVLAEIGGRMRQILVNALTVSLALGLLALLASYLEQRRRYMRTLYENAIRDPLTRLYTRLYMNDVVGRMLQGHDRGALAGVALVIFDVDHFKRVNDTFGHYVGDEVLVGVSAVILEAVRATDVPVRFGGEEVAVFLASERIEDALRFAERIRQQVEGTRFPLGDGHLSVTLSGGVALHRAGEQLSQLIIRADSALYKAKRGGRNRIAAESAGEVVSAGSEL